jgi:hypothetical protein
MCRYPPIRLPLAVVVAGTLVACGSGGGGETSGAPHDPSNISGRGFLRIDEPTSDSSLQTDSRTVVLKGASFNPNNDYTYYAVTWENEKLGLSGYAFTCVICDFAQTQWITGDIPLAFGINSITLTADDHDGNIGRDTIIVTSGNSPPDTTPPTVISVAPADGLHIGQVSTITAVIEFSEPMSVPTVNTRTVILTKADRTSIPTTVVATSATSAKIVPSIPLVSFTTYEIRVGGARDESGNPIVFFSSYFTTN